MFVPRRPIGVFIMIFSFIILTVLAVIQFGHHKLTSQDLKQQQWYQFVLKISDLGAGLVNNLQNNQEDLMIENLLLSNEEASKQKKYIQILKDETGWQFILQNNERIIFEKYLPIILQPNN